MIKKRDEFIAPAIEGMLRKKISVIVEGVLGGSATLKKVNLYRDLAKKARSAFVLVNLHVPLTVSAKRCRQRTKHIIGGKMPISEIKKWHAWFYVKKVKGIEIDTTCAGVKEAVNIILERIIQ